MQYHLCFNRSGSSQSCSKRTPMSHTTERFPVLAGTGIRLHPTGFRTSRIAASINCCQWMAREVANDLCVRKCANDNSNPYVDNPGFVKQQRDNSRHNINTWSKFKMGSTYLLLSACIVVFGREQATSTTCKAEGRQCRHLSL